MKIGIICGSHRSNSQSGKVARYIERELTSQDICEESWLYDLADKPLPFWDEGIWSGDEEWKTILGPIGESLHQCDGFVIVCPEWHGMVPAALKNFFLMWAAGGELAHKPALIVTISSGDGGSYPVAELRMSSYKNNRICFLPEHLIIRNVEFVFNQDETTNNPEAQTYFEDRLRYCLVILKEYAVALKKVRLSGEFSLKKYSSGM